MGLLKRHSFETIVFCLLIGAFSFMHSCKKEVTIQPPYSIVGSWNWVKSESYFMRHTETPASIGYEVIWKFDNSGNLTIYHADSAYAQRQYQLEYLKNNVSDPNSDSTLMLVLDIGSRRACSFTNDDLILDQRYLDGPISFYQKVN